MSDIEECAKAATEIAKLGSTSLETTGKLGGYLAKQFGETFKNTIGLMIGDKIFYLKSEKNWDRYLRMLDKINKDLLERGCKTTRLIPPKLEIPLVINASLEDGDNLQDIWCRLKANAMDSNFNLEIRFAYIDIVKNLTSLDANVLKFAYNKVSRKLDFSQKEPAKVYMAKIIVDLKDITKYMDVSEEELTISYNNLIRVQRLKLVSSLSPIYVKEGEKCLQC